MDQGTSFSGCSLASTLPGEKNRILTTPNMIAGDPIPCYTSTSYGGVNSDSILYTYPAYAGAIGSAVYSDDDVVVRGANMFYGEMEVHSFFVVRVYKSCIRKSFGFFAFL